MIQVTEVTERLKNFGYVTPEIQYRNIEFEIELILNYVINQCNFTSVTDIPSVLKHRIIDRICSEYLMKQKNAGNLENFDYSQAVKTIKEGDTQIQFGTENDGDTLESRFDKWVDYMQRGFDKWISVHRKIRW